MIGAAELAELGRLLWGTVIYRPYVYVFFACFLGFALRHLRGRGTLAYLLVAYGVAFLSEYSATRNGFPFGLYHYLDETRTRELWISNVPFWDSLSFVFLSYFSWLVASSALSPGQPERVILHARTAVLGGLLMMLLDVVIDPVALLGDRWFLGKIYIYPEGGSYFGVTLSNFAGWWGVGSVTIFLFQRISRFQFLSSSRWGRLSRWDQLGALGVYAGIFGFNLFLTAWIGEWLLFGVSLAWTALTLGWVGRRMVWGLRAGPSQEEPARVPIPV